MKQTATQRTKRAHAARSKEFWQAFRAHYTWHLRPPYDKLFDRSHWWKGKPMGKQRAVPCSYVFSDVKQAEPGDSILDSVSALYELARRHPLIGVLHHELGADAASKLQPDADAQNVKAVRCLLEIGLKSWAQLTEREQKSWHLSAGNMRGVDCRPESERCHAITDGALIFRQAFGDLRGKTPTVKDREQAIASSAVAAYGKGFRLFAIAPDLSADKAAELVRQQYGDESPRLLDYQPKWKVPKTRARCEDWPPIIADFENVATERKHGAKSPEFTRYRRALERLPFPSPPSQV